MRTYRLGETITIDVELQDESGIQSVAMFFRKDENVHIQMSYSGGIKPSGIFTLTYQVTAKTAPGDYSLTAFNAVDGKGNRKDYPTIPDWNFRIDKEAVDTEGPQLINVTIR